MYIEFGLRLGWSRFGLHLALGRFRIIWEGKRLRYLSLPGLGIWAWDGLGYAFDRWGDLPADQRGGVGVVWE